MPTARRDSPSLAKRDQRRFIDPVVSSSILLSRCVNSWSRWSETKCQTVSEWRSTIRSPRLAQKGPVSGSPHDAHTVRTSVCTRKSYRELAKGRRRQEPRSTLDLGPRSLTLDPRTSILDPPYRRRYRPTPICSIKPANRGWSCSGSSHASTFMNVHIPARRSMQRCAESRASSVRAI
jgi:hypothetical protein